MKLEVKNIYFDYNATCPMSSAVCNEILPLLSLPLNTSAVHEHGKVSKSIIENARTIIAKSLNASADYKIVFTSCATESNNLALKGLTLYKAFTTTIEHPSIFNILREGILPVDGNGLISLSSLEELCRELNGQKFLISIMAANNETGVIQPLKKASEIIHRYGGLIHSDAVQAFGKIHFDISDLNLDLVTISSHKIGGPFGASALIFKKNIELTTQLQGGGQEDRLRSGTVNTPAIAGFGKAAEIAVNNLDEYKYHTQKIRSYIENEIKSITAEAIIFSENVERLPNTISLTMPNVSNETQVIHFDLNGFSISAGSACSSNRLALPRVQMSMGFSEEISRTAIRISLGMNNTLEEAKKFVQAWKQLFDNTNKNIKAA